MNIFGVILHFLHKSNEGRFLERLQWQGKDPTAEFPCPCAAFRKQLNSQSICLTRSTPELTSFSLSMQR